MRLDMYLMGNGLMPSREKAKGAIKSGSVFVDGKVVNKPAYEVAENAKVEVNKADNFVSRGAYKIKCAYEEFEFSFENRLVMDIGASTGGFTQFAINNGAKKVYAVDVGRGELSPLLASDARVVNMEGTDFRSVNKDICKDVDLIIGDVSFISLKHIFPKICELFGEKIEIVMLFKPQFECGAEIAKKYKGVVLDQKLHKKLLKDFLDYVRVFGFEVSGLVCSGIRGKEGNIEYLFHLNGKRKQSVNIDKVVDGAFKKGG